MPNDRARRALEVFEASLEIVPELRAAFVDRNCGTDAALRADVASLLDVHDEGAALLPTHEADGDALTSGNDEATSQGHTPPPTPAPGVQIDDFLIKEQIGAGGMGVVYRAQQISLNRRVALKVLPTHLQFSAQAQTRFQHEVEAAARLHHPNIVGVFTTGQAGSTRYFAMELINGPPLSEVLQCLRTDPLPELRSASTHLQPLPTAAAARSAPRPAPSTSDAPVRSEEPSPLRDKIMADLSNGYFDTVAAQIASVADGLAYAHRRQVVHRDVKPSNLLYARDGALHLSDFGLARMLEQPGITHTGDSVGTPYYMAPEQVSSGAGDIDGRTDIYALGATLYELLTLQPPFPGDTRDQVIAQINRDEPRPPRRLNEKIPRDLETVCLKALAKSPARRYQSAEEFAADLRRHVERRPVLARRSTIVDRAVSRCRRNPYVASALAVAAGLLVATAVLGYNAYETSHRKALTRQQLDNAAARAARYEQDLEDAQAQISLAQQTQQQRVFEQAVLAAMQGDEPTVQAAVQEAERSGASPGRLHLLRGQIALLSGDFKIALAESDAAIKLMPDSLAAQALMAEAYARSDYWQESRELLREVRAMTPSSVEDLILQGRMESQHDAKAAEATLDRAIELDRQNVAARLIRGTIRAQRAYDTCDPGHAERALEDLQLAASLLPETPYLLSNLLNVHLTAAAAYDAADNIDASRQHLTQAGVFTNKLGQYRDEYAAHRWRAYYFERTGDLDGAIAEWQAIDDKTIGFLAMNLYRAGRFEEVFQACDAYGIHATTGTSDFCHSFTLAAIAASPEQLVADFTFDRLRTMDPNSSWRSVYTLWCLAGQPKRAQEEVRSLGLADQADRHERTRYQYFTGQINDDKYLQQAAPSRLEIGRANLNIGIHHLSQGRRSDARRHLQMALDSRLEFNFFAVMSRALLAQLDRDPGWPRWIPEEPSRVATDTR